ncbi:Nicotinamidase [Labilithrix luteola]|uniref:nicotinamidase n=1 Tax=Labilithrix luteola TaxID=1391654 RepID=A0A0K1PW97_9BACT|nr:isochorismatase family protein [Labilithrix luteola]AKU97787.1 Nicotinamidase [Labilithrix luteola]
MIAPYDANTALLVLDVQNDFASPGGSLAIAEAREILPFVNEEIARARRGGARVVYTQDWHPESTPHFQKDGGIWPTHCVHDSWGAAFHPDLVIDDPMLQLIRKGTGGEDGYSAFTVMVPTSLEKKPTELEQRLRAWGVKRIVIVGLATDYCVKDTSLDARRLGFDVTVLRDGTRAVNRTPGDGERALEELVRAGVHLR